MKTIRQVLDGPDKEAALELAYKLAEEMMNRPLTPEQERRIREDECNRRHPY